MIEGLSNKIESYKPLDKIKPFHTSKATNKCLLGGYGSGKTTALVWEVIDLMMRYPGMEWFLGRKFNEDVDMSIQRVFYEECPVELIQKKEKGGRICYVNYGKITFGGLYTRQKMRLKLPVVTGFGMDEAIEISDDDVRLLHGRLRAKKGDAPLMALYATNPPNIDHWIYEKFVLQKNDNYDLYKVAIYDNPFLPEEYIKNLEAEYKSNPNWVRRYLMGEFGLVSFGFPVYQGFRENLHVMELTHNRLKPILRGWDFGWVHPCVTFAQFDDKDRLQIFDTIMGNKIYLEDFAPQIIKFSNEKYPGCQWEDFCDFAGVQHKDSSKKTSIEILNSDPFNLKMRYKRTDDLLKAVQIVQKKMSNLVEGIPGITVNKTNRLAIEMFSGGYYYAKNPDGVVQEKPCKDGFFEHIADSIRYILQCLYNYKVTDSKGLSRRMVQPSFESTSSNKYVPNQSHMHYNRR